MDQNKLNPTPGNNSADFKPYVPPHQNLAEFTLKAVLNGIFFGILFGAANAYLGLRAGLTISTSIPVAVMTVAAFKVFNRFGKSSTILEANISQTVGSASSSVASGVIFTLPALFLWNLDPTLLQMTLLGILGGFLGILFMIPLRQFLIAREHHRLPYPEGTACAEVLKASQAGGARSKNVFLGIGVGALFKLFLGWFRLFPDDLHFRVPFIKKAELGTEISAALFGVGYILGPRIGAIMVGGGLLSWLVLIPAIAYWGTGNPDPLYPETTLPIDDMSPSLLWTRYIRYIGAGAVATGGLITLIRSIPTMIESFNIGSKQLRSRLQENVPEVKRTDKDLSLKVVGLGLLGVTIALILIPHLFGTIDTIGIRVAAAFMIVIMAFFFVTVSSRIVGLIGTTSNPTSGITIATLLATALLFVFLGWTDEVGKVAVLSVGAVVAIAASIAGDTSQDLKTGFLLGATPYRQQIGEFVGVLSSAAFVGIAVIILDQAYGFGTEELPAPQATLMKLVIEGVLDASLPWTMVGIGVGIAILCELVRIPSLPFAVGVYLPVSTMVPIFLGGLLKSWMEHKAKNEEDKALRQEKGILFGSGLVGGEGLLGVVIAGVAFVSGSAPEGLGYNWAGPLAPVFALGMLFLLFFIFYRFTTTK